mgnify:FL=1
MRMVDLIEYKKNNGEFNHQQIRFIIDGYVEGSIPDYQMSALLMAICFQGLTLKETALLTKVMEESGDIIDLSKIEGVKVDKHSTGGVGDKTSLVLGPIVAACGGKMAKMSGRGLGHTGGTLDKLESIPGYQINISEEDFINQVNEIGLAIIGQSASLVPADKKLYALRDVTGTVSCIPLIASSIMSKKLASGADTILLDVKYGNGAFMQTIEEAKELAQTMISIGKHCHKNTRATISSMSQPLGNAIGNSLEVIEAIETLKGNGPEDLRELCLNEGSEMLVQANLYPNKKEAYQALQEVMDNGKALEKFKEMVKAQGGDVSYIENTELFEKPSAIIELTSKKTGYIQALDYSYGENIIAENNENVGFFDDDDKLEYTVNVQKAGNYKMKLEYAKGEKDAEFDIYVDNVLTASSTLETTGSFSTYKTGTVAIDLPKGSHKIMFVPKNTGGFNLKSLSFGSYIKLENDLLKEEKLDGQKITVQLKDGKFNKQFNRDNWHIDLPQGVDFDLDRVSDTKATITLKGQEVVDYDNNRTLKVEIDAKEVGDKDYLLSDQTVIEAVDDKEMLEDIGNLDFDSNTLVLKITGGKFNQNIKTSDLTLSEEIAQYVKVSEVKVNKDGTEVSVILERTNTNYDDLVGTINVKPSGYSEGDIDLVANIKLLKTDRLPESINVKDEAVKLNESDAYRKRGTLVNGAKGDYLDFFLNIEEEGNYVLTYKVKDNEAVENGLKLSGGLGLATDNLGSVSFGKYWGNAQGYAQMLNLKAGEQTLRFEVNNPGFELTDLQIKKLTDVIEVNDTKDGKTTISADQVVDGSKEIGWAIEGSSTKNIGFGSAGTYQDYYVDVKTAGLYDLKVNYSHDCASDTKAIAMRVDGNTTTQLGEVTLKNTGGWANYQDSDTIEIRLEAGKQFIRIYDDIDGFNYRHVQLTFKGKQDVTQPEITGKDAIVCVGDETDIKDLLELKATDDIDGDLSDKLTISGDYDCHQVGIYIITVTVSDQAGNEATKLFKIKVVEKAKLVVDAKEFIVGDEFDPLTGVKVYDVDGTNITEKLTVVSNNVNVNKAGTYQVTYRVVDALGNEVEFTREVIVKKVKTDVEPSNPDVPSVSKPNDSSSDNQLSSSNGGQETIVGQVVKSTKTGDNTQLVTMMSMLLLAGIGFIVLKRRKYNH